MNEPAPWPLVLGTVLVWAALAMPKGCREMRTPPRRSDIAWDSPRMREIQKEWEALRKNREGFTTLTGKEAYVEARRRVERLLRKRFSEEDLHQLAGSCEVLPVRTPMEVLMANGDYNNEVLTFIVKVFVDSGDWDGLVTLLSRQCPGRIEVWETIEWCLVRRGKRLKDPILILGEAYQKCEVPETRHDLAATVRRAFGGLGIRGEDDAEFVRNAMQWYDKAKDHLTVNREYWRNDMYFPVEQYEMQPELYNKFPQGMERELLFKEKPSESPVLAE
jgi:hypothetical protein